MMATVACAAVPKITLVIGGSFGADSYVMVRERSCVLDALQTHPCSILRPSFVMGFDEVVLCGSVAVWAIVQPKLPVPVA